MVAVKTLSGTLALFCIIALIVQVAGAAGPSQPPGGSPMEVPRAPEQNTPTFTVPPTPPPTTPIPTTTIPTPTQLTKRQMPPADLILALERKGYDVSGVQEAVASGDREAMNAWLDAFQKSHPGVLEEIEQNWLAAKTDRQQTVPTPWPVETTQPVQARTTEEKSGGIPGIWPVTALVVAVVLLAGTFAIYRWRKRAAVSQISPSDTLAHSSASLSPEIPLSPAPSTRQLPQELADRYTEAEFIGKGGFAAVYRVKREDGKIVALKIPIVMDASTGKTFIAELQNWTRLSHPNIVAVYDYNILPVPYFELEYCESSLACIPRPIPPGEAEWLIFNVCEGLKFTHSLGLIHRDLKPENILLKDNIPKISDWGLSRAVSRATSMTTTSYTPSYAAPEQINNQHKDERTDVWQVGVILYELVTGEQPFTGDTMLDLMTGILTREPERPGTLNPDAAELEPVIEMCLKKDPAERYQSVAELEQALVATINRSCEPVLREWKENDNIFQSDFFYGELLLMNMKCGNAAKAAELAADIALYDTGEGGLQMEKIARQLDSFAADGVTEIPEPLIKKAASAVNLIRNFLSS